MSSVSFKSISAPTRGMSPNTVFAYRDAIKLFLLFLVTHTGREAARLSLDHLHADAVLAFLGEIETRERRLTTRNLRLSALRTFFGYLAVQDSLRAGQYQRVIAIPLKASSRTLVGYIEVEEVRAILGSIDQTTSLGRRDYALISLFYNTGARVQEICDLKGEDVSQSPPLVIVTGKGRKTRQVPLWPQTAGFLADYTKGRDPRERLFLDARGMPLTRLGIYHIIGARAKAAVATCPSLAKKRSPLTRFYRLFSDAKFRKRVLELCRSAVPMGFQLVRLCGWLCRWVGE